MDFKAALLNKRISESETMFSSLLFWIRLLGILLWPGMNYECNENAMHIIIIV